MTDLSWSGWGTIVSVLLALIPAVIRFRDSLAKLQDLITEIAGIIVLLGGLFLYMVTVPRWLPIRAQMEGLGADVETVTMVFFGSIALISLGAMLTLFGLFGRITTSLRRK